MITKTYGSWFAVKFNPYDNPTKTLRKPYDNAAFCTADSNWRESWL